MPYKSNEEETYLREQLVRLQREYQSAAQPYVDRLVFLESMKPPPVFTVSWGELSPQQRKRLDPLYDAAKPE